MISKFLEIKVLLSVMRIDSYVINGILDLLYPAYNVQLLHLLIIR